MICKKCGARFSDGMFCPECGASMALVVDLDEKGIEHLEEDCDTSKYGTYGELEEQCINKEIKINAGGKKVFENKKLIFKNSIIMEETANLEFRNCLLEIDDKVTAIWANKGGNIKFEDCNIKGIGSLIGFRDPDWAPYSGYEDTHCCMFKFWNCDLSNRGVLIDKIFASAYFEKCIIRGGAIELKDAGGLMSFARDLKSKLEIRNCVINKMKISVEGNVNLENCTINDSFDSIHSRKKISVKNCYFDGCYPEEANGERRSIWERY